MDKHLHRKLIKRLFLVWGLLSLLIGTLIFYLSMKKVDVFVANLAEKESRTFSSKEISTFLNMPTDLDKDALKINVERRLTKSHFIVAELYNLDKEKVVEIVKSGYQSIEDEINEHKHDSYLSDLMRRKAFLINSRIYLQIFTPLMIGSSTKIGFFEGIYEVDEETMSNITGEMSRSFLEVVFAILATTIVLYPVIISLNRDLVQHTKNLVRANIETLKVLGSAIAKRDGDTSEHNFRVTLYAIRLAETIGIKRKNIQGIIKGAFLHDVGKIAISDTILLKPMKLTPEEFITMQSHVLHGLDIIKEDNSLRDGSDVVRCHHEKFDGSGYPVGLKGDDIPISAKIFTICDVFDALASKRPYKEPFPLEKVIRILQEESGIRFDPEILVQFIQSAPSFYSEIALSDEETLHKMLDQSILEYF